MIKITDSDMYIIADQNEVQNKCIIIYWNQRQAASLT